MALGMAWHAYKIDTTATKNLYLSSHVLTHLHNFCTHSTANNNNWVEGAIPTDAIQTSLA